MKQSKLGKWLIIGVILIANVGCDQVSKVIVREQIPYRQTIQVLDPYFTLTNVENKGAFLSTGNAWPEPVRIAVLTILPILVIGWAFYYLLTKQGLTRLRIIGIALMISGGIGNIYDRIIYGSVTDFLYIDLILFHTGVFNLADVSIMLGMFISVFDSLKSRNEEKFSNIPEA